MIAADIALIVVPVGFGAILLTVAVLLAIAVRNYEPGEVVCNLDCRDLHRFGLTAPDCPAGHGTDHFITPRAQVELENALDGQVRFTR